MEGGSPGTWPAAWEAMNEAIPHTATGWRYRPGLASRAVRGTARTAASLQQLCPFLLAPAPRGAPSSSSRSSGLGTPQGQAPTPPRDGHWAPCPTVHLGLQGDRSFASSSLSSFFPSLVSLCQLPTPPARSLLLGPGARSAKADEKRGDGRTLLRYPAWRASNSLCLRSPPGLGICSLSAFTCNLPSPGTGAHTMGVPRAHLEQLGDGCWQLLSPSPIN